MRKTKGRTEQYEEPRFVEEAEEFEPGESFDEHGIARAKPRSVGQTRQRLEMRDEEQWLRKQLADWGDADFDWEDDEDEDDE